MAVQITIGGADKTGNVLVQSCSIEKRLAGRGTARIVVIDKSIPPTYRPAMLAEIVISDGGTMFAGIMTDVEETAINEPERGILSRVTAIDYSLYASRVVVNETYAAGRADKSIKAIISDLRTTYLDQYGVTLDAGMLAGPDILGEVVFDYATCAESLDHVCALAGWIWYIDTSKVLKAHVPGAGSATPVTLSVDNCRLVSWQRAINQYRNREVVYYTGGVVTSEDAAQIALYGVFEHVTEAADITDATTATTLADGLIRMYANLPKIVRAQTYVTGFNAGQQGTITIAPRDISGLHLMQSVTHDYEPANGGRWRTTVEAVEGDERTGSWVDLWKAILGTGLSASSGGRTTGGVVVTVGGAVPISFHLGGSRVLDVVYAGSSDVPDYADVTLDADDYPSLTTRQVRCQVRSLNGATSVTPRLYNVTDSTVAGTGASSTSATWAEQAFSVTLASGAKRYRLQITAGDANGGVQGIGALYLS